MPTAASRMMPTLRRVVLAGAAADRTDGQLLGAFVVDRDADAFAGLVRRHGPMVLGVCRRVTGDRTAADDAFQAVFIVLARRAGAVKPRERVGNWLYGVAYRTALKARMVLARRRSREKQVDVMPEPPGSPPPAAEWSDLQPVIDEELARLPEKLRLPVILCDLEGRAQREVAKHLGLPPATLATRLATARRTLAARLTKRGVTLSGGALAGLLSAHGTAAAVPYALAHGVARAAEAVASGGAVSSLVSAHAVQLSEGVMRMMLLSKLKAVAAAALTAAVLTGGLGLGLMPAAAGDDPGQQAGTKPAAVPVASVIEFTLGPTGDMDDVTFLKRLSMDIRGTAPTDVETVFFVADDDDNKRAKVVVWMVGDDRAREVVAKRLGVPAERVRMIRGLDIGDGKPRDMLVVVDTDVRVGVNPMVKGVMVARDGQDHAALTVEKKVQALESGSSARVQRIELGAEGTDIRTVYRRIGAITDSRTPAADEPKGGFFHIYDSRTGKEIKAGKAHFAPTADDMKTYTARVYTASLWDTALWDTADEMQVEAFGNQLPNIMIVNRDVRESDAEFLKRATTTARGTPPTALESKYFAEDKDPKKREKLLDALLKDPSVAKKLGDDWKKKMLAAPAAGKDLTLQLYVPNFEGQLKFKAPLDFDYLIENPKAPTPPATPGVKAVPAKPSAPTPPKPPGAVPAKPAKLVPPAATQADRLEKLVGELLAAKKSDADMLEAVTLVVLGRLPTDAEKRLTLGLVSKAADRKAAWVEVVRALGSADEGEGAKRDVLKLKGENTPSGDAPAVVKFRLMPEVVPLAKPK